MEGRKVMKKKFYGSPLLTDADREKYKVAIRRGYCESFGTSEWNHSFVGQFLKKNPKRVKILDIMSAMLGHHPSWSDLNDDFLKDLREVLARGMCASSLRTTLAIIKAVINDNKHIKIDAIQADRILTSKKESSQAVYLTEDEIEKINQYKPSNWMEEYVKRIFLIGCYTLARHSDCVRLTEANVDVKRNIISYVSQKTKDNTIVPLHKNVMKYLQDHTVEDITDDEFNRTIREICMKCNIDERVTIFRRGAEESGPKWRFVSSHTARRSAATNLYLRNADILQISRMMGHSSVKVTQSYIVGYRELDSRALGYFGYGEEEK